MTRGRATSGAIQLWVVDLHQLDPVDRTAADTPRARRQAQQQALQRVADQAGVEIFRSCQTCGEGGHGRPEVRGGRFDISITWAGRWGIVALADGRVGIDAALLRTAPRPVTSALSAAETAALASLPERGRREMFVRLWSAKEAIAKADGRGLTLPLAQLDAAPVVAEGRALVAVDRTTWYVAVLDHRFPDRQPVAVAIAADRTIHDVVWRSGPTS